MGQQLRVKVKRARRKAYKERKNVREKAAATAAAKKKKK